MTQPSEMPIDFHPWTQDALMSECWMRDFDYEADVLRVADLFGLEHPTKEQYEEHCRKEYEKMEAFYLWEIRGYYESGCACIVRSGTMVKLGPEVSDAKAVAYYTTTCKCSRNLQPEDFQWTWQ